MMDEWHSSAKNLLYHFRVIVRGMVPFRCVWSPEMQEKAGLDDESVAYIQNVASMVAERSTSHYCSFYSSLTGCG